MVKNSRAASACLVAVLILAVVSPQLFLAERSGATTVVYASIKLAPIADAKVENHTPDTNYGSETHIAAAGQHPEWYKRSFLKFDLSQIPSDATITEAKLFLYRYDDGGVETGDTNREIGVYRVSNDTWSESAITWNNQPAIGDLEGVARTYFADEYYRVYTDAGVPSDSAVWTWSDGGQGSFDGEFTGIVPPEGQKSFKTSTNAGSWAGWGVILNRNVVDDSGLGNHGTINGGVTENSGKIYRALGFNGTNAYVSVADSSSLNPARVTVEAWAYFAEQPSAGTRQVIVSKFEGASWSSKGYELYIETTGGGQFQLVFGVGPGSGEWGSFAVYQTTFQTGWHHLVGTYNGSTLALYYDGSQVATADWTGNIASNTKPLCVGRKADGEWGYFKGIIDEVRVENQAISETEVSYRYNSGSGRYLGPNENTVLLFHFDLPIYVNLSGATALKFWVKTSKNLKVEIEAPKWNTQTKYISNYGWDGTDRWQQITIPASEWSSLDQVYSPFKITIESSGTFYVDKVRWVGISPYSDGGIPQNSEILTWYDPNGTATFDANYSMASPEGTKCFKVSTTGAWAGFGVFVRLPYNHTEDLSTTTSLKFWVKTPSNLKVEIEAPEGTTQTKYIGDYGWDGTENWQEITIPASAWSNLSQVFGLVKITIETSGTFYVDFIRWEGVSPRPTKLYNFWENWDVTDWVAEQFGGDGTVSLALRAVDERADWNSAEPYWYSKEWESSGQRPYLLVTYTASSSALPAHATIQQLPSMPPEVLSVVPATTGWTPYVWTTVTVTVRDNNMNLQNIYLMAYEGSLDNTASDDARNHYTWVASKTEAGWSFSCPLGGAYLDSTNSSVTENSDAKTYTAVFKVRVAKTAAPGTWDLYARGVDSQNADSYLENAGVVTVAVYLELSLDDTTATFSGMQSQTVGASENPTVATVTANTNFNIDVKGAGDWSGPGTLSLSTTKADQDGSAPYDLSLSTSWQSLWSGVGWGESVQKNIYWFLVIPVDATPGNYTNTLYVRVSA